MRVNFFEKNSVGEREKNLSDISAEKLLYLMGYDFDAYDVLRTEHKYKECGCSWEKGETCSKCELAYSRHKATSQDIADDGESEFACITPDGSIFFVPAYDEVYDGEEIDFELLAQKIIFDTPAFLLDFLSRTKF